VLAPEAGDVELPMFRRISFMWPSNPGSAFVGQGGGLDHRPVFGVGHDRWKFPGHLCRIDRGSWPAQHLALLARTFQPRLRALGQTNALLLGTVLAGTLRWRSAINSFDTAITFVT